MRSPPILMLLLCIGACFSPKQVSADLEGRANVVEAAFVLKFPDFVTWPESLPDRTSSVFRIVVLGKSEIYNHLKDLEENTVFAGRPLQVRSVDTIEKIGDAEIVFIGSQFGNRLGEVVSELSKKPVLTVSDLPNAFRQGVMINFLIQENKVRFEVNKEKAEQVGLSISFRLLQVAVNNNTGGTGN